MKPTLRDNIPMKLTKAVVMVSITIFVFAQNIQNRTYLCGAFCWGFRKSAYISKKKRKEKKIFIFVFLFKRRACALFISCNIRLAVMAPCKLNANICLRSLFLSRTFETRDYWFVCYLLLLLFYAL